MSILSAAAGLLPSLAGVKGMAIAAGIALLAGTWAGYELRDLQADREALAREQVYSAGLRLINAASDAAAEVAAADAKRGLEAAEAAAAAERERAEELAGQLESIRSIPDAENCALGLETMKILEGLM